MGKVTDCGDTFVGWREEGLPVVVGLEDEREIGAVAAMVSEAREMVQRVPSIYFILNSLPN